jgi:hypothetical protein
MERSGLIRSTGQQNHYPVATFPDALRARIRMCRVAR